jgi:hypothetical protein
VIVATVTDPSSLIHGWRGVVLDQVEIFGPHLIVEWGRIRGYATPIRRDRVQLTVT